MTLGDEIKSSGVTEKTPKNIMVGAGTIHKGLKFENGAWNFHASLLCATANEGNKVSIMPEITPLEVDGVAIRRKGLDVKTGEKATMDFNPVELTPETLAMPLFAVAKTSETAEGYDEITSKATIDEGDYVENLAYVGKTLGGKPIIIIFDWAICTSGLELEGKNKNAVVPTLSFECVADLVSEADTLPWHIYYPTPAA